jgi:hypothetical protein
VLSQGGCGVRGVAVGVPAGLGAAGVGRDGM